MPKFPKSYLLPGKSFHVTDKFKRLQMSILLKLLPILRTFTLLSHFRHHLLCICCAQLTKALFRSHKFRSPKMNLNAFLCRFPTVFGKYIRILDQVSKIRRFHSIPFEFQGFENRPQICFLPFRILYCKPILRALSLLVCGIQNV